MGFSKEIKEKALIACKRHCVLCECQKDINIECHHIIPRADGGEDTFENCIPLCFDCHSKIESYNPKHPKGNKFSPKELKTRRDSFYQRVANGEFPKRTDNVSSNNEDKILYKKIKKMFQSPNLEYYLTEFDLGNDFNNEIFAPLSQLIQYNDNPDYEFIDDEIEKYKKNLFTAVEEFLHYKAINVFPSGKGTYKLDTCEESAYFNDLATAIWDAYKAFIKICKRKLN